MEDIALVVRLSVEGSGLDVDILVLCSWGFDRELLAVFKCDNALFE